MYSYSFGETSSLAGQLAFPRRSRVAAFARAIAAVRLARSDWPRGCQRAKEAILESSKNQTIKVNLGGQVLGGYGSTRWNWHNKRRCTEDCLCLDADKLVRAGLLNQNAGRIEWWSEGKKISEVRFSLKNSDVPEILYLYLGFTVRRKGKDEAFWEPIPIEIRRQRIGKRFFFRCHLWCACRVRKLYRPTVETVFGCRTCQKLTYRSAQKHDKSMDIFRGNSDLLMAAIQAGSAKAICFALRNLGVLDVREPALLKVRA